MIAKMNLMKSYNPRYLFKNGFYIRFLEISRIFGCFISPLDIIYAKAQVGILEKSDHVSSLLKKRYLFHKPTFLQIHRIARFYPQECLNYWLETEYYSPIILEICRKYDINISDEIKAKCLKSKIKDIIILQNGWNGINAYLASYGLEAVVSKGIWSFLSNVQYDKCRTSNKVTILMTCFNSSTTIETAITSVMAQTHQNIQLLVIDDASVDDTYAKLEVLKKRFSHRNFSIFRNNNNLGTYASKEKLLQKADPDSEFITCMDSDDWSHPEKIERQVRHLIDFPNLVANMSYWVRFDELGNPYSQRIFPFLSLNPSSLMIRIKDIATLDRIWDTTTRYGADQELILRLQNKFGSKRIGYLKLPLSFARYREGSLTTLSHIGCKTNRGRLLRARYINNKFFKNS